MLRILWIPVVAAFFAWADTGPKIMLIGSNPKVGPVEVAVDFGDKSLPMEIKKITLEGNMTHPGMVPVFGEATKVSDSRYKGRLELTMAGDWRITAFIELADGRTVERTLDVRGVR